MSNKPWRDGNDGELRQTVNLFPSGLEGSNPFPSTNFLMGVVDQRVDRWPVARGLSKPNSGVTQPVRSKIH